MTNNLKQQARRLTQFCRAKVRLLKSNKELKPLTKLVKKRKRIHTKGNVINKKTTKAAPKLLLVIPNFTLV